MTEDVVDRWFPRARLIAAGPTAQQARARPDGCQPVAAKASIPRTVCVTPLPARILAASKVDVTWRRQGRWNLFSRSRNSHGDRWTGARGPVVVWQRVAMRVIYPNSRG